MDRPYKTAGFVASAALAVMIGAKAGYRAARSLIGEPPDISKMGQVDVGHPGSTRGVADDISEGVTEGIDRIDWEPRYHDRPRPPTRPAAAPAPEPSGYPARDGGRWPPIDPKGNSDLSGYMEPEPRSGLPPFQLRPGEINLDEKGIGDALEPWD
jgi:hypothetical protein